MAYSRTLAELELAVRREADMVNSQFVTSAEVREYINQSWAELYDRIVLFDQEYLLKSATAASNGTGKYDILNDFKTGIVVKILSIDVGGVGYFVGDVVLLSGGGITPSLNALGKVTSINPATGAITGIQLVHQGYGYYLPAGTGGNYPHNHQVDCISDAGENARVTVYIDSDFYKCKGIWITSGSASTSDNGSWNPLRRFNWEAQNALNQSNTYGSTFALPYYRIVTQFGFDKALLSPDANGTYKLWYYPAPYKMLVDDDRIDGRAGWDEWVIKDSAIKCLLKEESVEQAAAIKAARDELFQRFQLHASERDASQPEKIRNVNLLSRRYTPWR